MSKLDRGNSHISIGVYMVQADWPLVGRVRSIVGYDNKEIQPEISEETIDGEVITTVLSTLDDPKKLLSPTHERYDPTAVEEVDGEKSKLAEGWQQFRGSFEPMRKSLYGLTKIFARYKSFYEVRENDATSIINGAGNVVEGVTQIVLVPIFLICRLLKHLGLMLRHPFTGASYSNLVVRFARDIGYSGTWLIEGTLETVQGVIRIVMQVPKWVIQMPFRGLRTRFTGSKTYATFAENAGTQALIQSASQQLDAARAKKQKTLGNARYYKDKANNAFDEFLGKVEEVEQGKEKVLSNHSWEKLQEVMDSLKIPVKFYDGTWPDFYAAATGKTSAPQFEELVAACYYPKQEIIGVERREKEKEYSAARTVIVDILKNGLQKAYREHLREGLKTPVDVRKLFFELRCKADRVEEHKGQVVDKEKRAKLQDTCKNYNFEPAREAVLAYGPQTLDL